MPPAKSEPAASAARPRFMPSDSLAQMALRASVPANLPLSTVNGGPVMERIDVATPAAERLDVAPSSLPDDTSAGAVDRARESIGVRVERMLATLAFRAAAQGQRELRISEDSRFTPLVSRELLHRIPVNIYEATSILDQLHQELQALADGPGLTANWGKLSHHPDGLVLELNPFQPEPVERTPARIIGPQG
jgi:hypothetical protein